MHPIESNSTATQRPSGMSCPVCSNFISVNIHQLLYDGAITCPHCGLKLDVNRSSSKTAIDALRKVENALARVRDTEKFKL